MHWTSSRYSSSREYQPHLNINNGLPALNNPWLTFHHDHLGPSQSSPSAHIINILTKGILREFALIAYYYTSARRGNNNLMMKLDDFLDTYYFTKVNTALIDELAQEFPSVFTKKKKVPLNFQLRLSEFTEHSSTRFTERKERLSAQNKLAKIDLRQKYMMHVLLTRNQHFILKYHISNDDLDVPIWLYIGKDDQLQGPINSLELQALFETRALKPETLVKKKMQPEFTQACHLLNKYCRSTIIKEFEDSRLAYFVNPKKKQPLTDEEAQEDQRWLKVIGKRVDASLDNPLFNHDSRPSSFTSANPNREKRQSVNFKNPEFPSAKTKAILDPSQLFCQKVQPQEINNNQSPKRSALRSEDRFISDSFSPSSHTGFRKRVATQNFKKSKK